MISIFDLQNGLLQWFLFQENREMSRQLVEKICLQLFLQYYPAENPKLGKYRIFYPLLKNGLIEYYGQNRFGLAPSSVLIGRKYCLGINLPIDAKNEINLNNDNLSMYRPLIFGIGTVDRGFFAKHKIPQAAFDLNNLLDNIQPFEKIVESWPPTMVAETKGFQKISSNGWNGNFNFCTKGLYRSEAEAYAKRIVKTDQWRLVPDRTQNIDGFNLAACWSIAENGEPLQIEYNRRREELHVGSIYFPILLGRLLFFHHCLQTGSKPTDRYTLNEKSFSKLNRLFNNKICSND